MSLPHPRRGSLRSRILPLVVLPLVLLAAPSRLRSEEADTGDEAPAPSTAPDLKQLEQAYRAEKDDKKRAALVGKMTWLPGAPELLRRILATDPADDVALAAGNAWRRVLLGEVLGGSQGRLDATADPVRRARLAREIERYQVFAAGQNLPRFLREAPPVFEVKTRSRDRVRLLAFGDFGDGSSRQERIAEAMRRDHAEQALRPGHHAGRQLLSRWHADADRRALAARVRAALWTAAPPVLRVLGNHDWVLADSPAAEVLHSGSSDTMADAGRAILVRRGAGPVLRAGHQPGHARRARLARRRARPQQGAVEGRLRSPSHRRRRPVPRRPRAAKNTCCRSCAVAPTCTSAGTSTISSTSPPRGAFTSSSRAAAGRGTYPIKPAPRVAVRRQPERIRRHRGRPQDICQSA